MAWADRGCGAEEDLCSVARDGQHCPVASTDLVDLAKVSYLVSRVVLRSRHLGI